MTDALLVFRHLFNWRFLAVLGALTALGLFLPDRIIKPFRSVRFNVYLFLVIAVASAAGTFFPQAEADLYVYHTWWFAFLLGLMAFDVVACKLRRLPLLVFGPARSKKTPHAESAEQFFSKSKLKMNFSTKTGPPETAEHVRSWLRGKGLTFQEQEHPSGTAFFTGRHLFQRWGDFILHVSIVAVLAGNMMGVMFGFNEVLAIKEGTSVKLKNRPYDVTLNDFDIEYYRGTGAPSLYKSDLTVKENGAEIGKKRIVVNDPLDIGRIRFYQASWGMTYDFRSARLHVAGRDIELHQNEVTSIPGTPLSVRPNQFLPSFAFDAAGEPTTVDFQGKNPALQVDFLKDGKVQARAWLLKNSPQTAYRIENGRVVSAVPPPFSFTDIDPILFSGIQVGYDPGAPLFWMGAIALLFGLALHFYMHQRRYRILISPKGAGSDVTVGGWNSRTAEDFQQEFSAWSNGLRQTVS